MFVYQRISRFSLLGLLKVHGSILLNLRFTPSDQVSLTGCLFTRPPNGSETWVAVISCKMTSNFTRKIRSRFKPSPISSGKKKYQLLYPFIFGHFFWTPFITIVRVHLLGGCHCRCGGAYFEFPWWLALGVEVAMWRTAWSLLHSTQGCMSIRVLWQMFKKTLTIASVCCEWRK